MDMPSSAGHDSLSILDLPQLYTRPSASELLAVLAFLTEPPARLSYDDQETDDGLRNNDPAAIPRYLTALISSRLHWIDENAREEIWSTASSRLSERAGRTAMSSITRRFNICVSESNFIEIQIHEPSITSDNLGLKTWTSSVLLANKLRTLKKRLPSGRFRALELGSGTGLVGIAAACAWAVDVTLTDLPEILPNLQRNLETNLTAIQSCGGKALVCKLDWSEDIARTDYEDDRYPVILAADPLYSPEHPELLTQAVDRWLQRSRDACFVIEVPLRQGYHSEREELKDRLLGLGLHISESGYDSGPEDWRDRAGKQVEVECWWSLWQYQQPTTNAA